MKLCLNVTSFCFLNVWWMFWVREKTLTRPVLISLFKWFRREMCAKSAARTAVFLSFSVYSGAEALSGGRRCRSGIFPLSVRQPFTPPRPLPSSKSTSSSRQREVTWPDIHEESCGARLLTIILIILTDRGTRTARNKNAEAPRHDAEGRNA